MKNSTLAASFVALNLFHLLPDGIHSFTLPATTTTTNTATFRAAATIRRAPTSSSTSTNLHGLPPLPGFLTRKKASSDEETTSSASADTATDIPALPGQGAISNIDMTTEMSLETTTSADSSDTTAPGDEQQQLTETQSLLQKVKQAGTAGAISYALWELGFWGVSIPICVVGYYQLTGHWPDFANKEDMEKVGAEAFAFVNFARLAVPLRIGLALSTTPWIDENIVQKFMKKGEEEK